MNETIKQEVIIAPGVAESIVALAVAQVEGVAQIGSKTSSSGGLLSTCRASGLANRRTRYGSTTRLACCRIFWRRVLPMTACPFSIQIGS